MIDREIDYNGQKATISLLELREIKGGQVAKILKLVLKKVPGTPIPDIDYDGYMIALATNFIKKAPWTIESPSVLHEMPWPTYSALMGVLAKEYPAETFLSPYLKLIFGSMLENTDSISSIDSITNVQNTELPNAK